jgi:pimeloyl-ACP methyl ester carboxylesterase
MRFFGNNIKMIVNNLLVSYTDQGEDDAPVIIFIHGFPLNKSSWDNQLDALKENYRVIAYDIRGHGETEIGNCVFSIERFVIDLLYFMDALKIEKASICGLSMGGYIALVAIENYPHRFESLVLCDTNCMGDSKKTIEKRLNSIDTINEKGVKKYAEESLKNLFAPESFTTKVTEIAAVKEMIVNTSEESLAKTLMALSIREETCSLLHYIKVPTLILVGEYDIITPLEAATVMNEKIINSKLHIIADAGHLSNMENPTEFNHQLVKFFASVYNKQEVGSENGSGSYINQIWNQLRLILSFKI